MDPKKTDAMMEDDPHQSEGEEDIGDLDRPSKADLEGPEETDAGEVDQATSTEEVGTYYLRVLHEIILNSFLTT